MFLMLKCFLLTLVLAAALYGQDHAVDSRAAGCGPTETQFDLKTDKKQNTLAQPESGKALVYVFSEYIGDPHHQTIGT
jgi:hypothetical protein